jgi:hypothetical protein
VPGRRLRGSPRVSRAMIDVLYAVGSCDGVVGGWEVSSQPEGLVVRLRSLDVFEAEATAVEAAETMVKRVVSGDYQTVSSTVAARTEGRAADRWRGLAELVVAEPR